MTDDSDLLKKFNQIVDAETADAQAANDGCTDVETVASRVKKRCKPFLNDLLMQLGLVMFNSIIGKRMKHGVKGFRFRAKKKNKSKSLRPNPSEQLIFEGMEPFVGYPAQLTYEDKPGHVVFVDSRKARQSDREKAEEYLEQLLEWDKQRISYLKKGNRFALKLVATYGDLPLEKLIDSWKQDHSDDVLEK
jgi:hypothetical protein